MRVIGDLARLAARRHPDKAAFVLGGDILTYATLDRRSNQLAHGLAGCGVAAGDRVAILARNRLDYGVVSQAVAKAGAIIVPVNPRYAAPEIAQVLADATPRVLFVEPELAAVATEAVRGLAPEPVIVAMDGAGAFGELMAGDGAAPPDIAVGPDDAATIMYTSGTTGVPKGVLYAHGAHFMLFEAQIVELDLAHDDILHIASPLFTNGGLNGGINCTLLIGATGVVHGGSFDPDGMLGLIERHRITVGFWVPTMISILASHPAATARDHSSLRKVFYGSQPIGPDLLALGQRTFPTAQFYQIYGSTEVGFVSVLRPEDHARWSHVTGREAFNCESRIVGDDGRETPVGDVGEIVVRQRTQGMIGYWRNPEATAETIRDGWIHTGDLARVEGEGFFTLVDRKRDLIISGAENIYPKEIELVIARLPAVREVAVFGIPDDRFGESVCAAIALQPGATLSEAEIEAHCLAHLARYKRPRRVDFLDDLPKNAMGKIVKGELRKPYWVGRSRAI